jgi:hypothetical protein
VGVQIVGAQGAQGAAVQEIKAAGGWKSSTSADLYMKLERPGVEFSSTMMKKL